MQLQIIETGPMPVNTYILEDEKSKEAVIIDLGGGFKQIKEDLDGRNYKIKYILNTHGHFDHVLGGIYVQKNYPDIPIYMHKDDLPHIINLKQEMRFFGENAEETELKINNFIDENSNLDIGGRKIQILHTPGHSKGSLSFYIENRLFSGDALFFRSIGRTDFYDGDYNTLINSIKTKLFNLPDSTVVYPGHGISTVLADEKKYNQYLNIS